MERENNDIKLYNKNTKFKVRVAAIIKSNNYILLETYDDESFIFPGGHVEINESSIDAVKREIKEEIGKEIEIENFAGIIENFFVNVKDEYTHCIDFFYNCTMEVDKYDNFSIDEIDHGILMHHNYKWIKIDEVNNYNIKPSILKDYMNSKTYFHIINRD